MKSAQKRSVIVPVLVVATMVAGLITLFPQMALSNGATVYSASGTITVSSSATTVGLTTGPLSGNATLNVSDLAAAVKIGDVSIDAGTINFAIGALVDLSVADASPTAARTLTMKSDGDIKLSAGSGLIGGDHPLSLVFWTDNASSPVGGFIWFDGGAGASKVDIQTKGGHLWMGGGSGSVTWNGLTVGNSFAVGNRTTTNGIQLIGATLLTTGGSIAIYGKGESGVDAASGNNKNGIRTFLATNVDSGSGTIYMEGRADGTSNNANNGVELSETSGTYIRSSNSTAQAIYIEGHSTGAHSAEQTTSRRWGVYTHATKIESTGGGTIHIKGGGSKNAGVTIASGGAEVTNGGEIILEGTAAGLTNPHEVFVRGAISATDGTVTLQAPKSVSQESGALTAANLALRGGGAFTLTGTANAIGTVAAGSSASKVASLSLYDASGGLTIGQVGSLEGVTATGNVLIETGAGDITLAKSIATDSTSNTAITVNAGKSTAAGTATGGNIVVSGSPTLTAGANAIVRMFSGSESASTGLTALVGGSANVYYGIDENLSPAPNPALSGGRKYAFYRSSVAVQQPRLSSLTDVSGIVGGSATLTPPNATDQSNNPVAGTTTWSSSNPAVASVSGSTVTYGAAGTAVITATFTPSNTSNFSVVTTTFTVTVSAAPSGDSSGGSSSGSSAAAAPTPVVPAPAVTPRPSRLAFGPPDTSPVRQPVQRPGLRFDPDVPSRGTIGGVATNVSNTPVGTQGVAVVAGAFQFGVSLNGAQGAAVHTDTPSRSPELFMPRGESAAVSGSGSYPGSFVQLWLPNGTTSRELARIPVRSDGTFTSDVSFVAGSLEMPVPIGRQVLQVVGYDERGNQTVVDMTINIGQGAPAPEPNRQVGELPALAAGQSLGTSGGMPEAVSVTGLPDSGSVVVEGGGWVVSVNADRDNGVVENTAGNVLVRLDQSSTGSASGSGFLPGTLATVWLFSEPTLMATVTVDDNGEFSSEFLVDARLIAPGEHTLQIQGVGTDGFIKAANLGVLVEQPIELTTESASGLLWWVLGFFVLALLLMFFILLARRRRRQDA